MRDYLQPSKPVGWDKRIKEIDPKLSTVWNAPRRRWEIHYDSGRGLGPKLAIVVGDGYNYQPLDERVLRTLRAGDSHRIGLKEVCRILDEEEKAWIDAQRKQEDNMTDAISREMADHTRLIQKPIGVVTEKEIYKGKAPTRSTSNDDVV